MDETTLVEANELEITWDKEWNNHDETNGLNIFNLSIEVGIESI